jgi:hypothetical protein
MLHVCRSYSLSLWPPISSAFGAVPSFLGTRLFALTFGTAAILRPCLPAAGRRPTGPRAPACRPARLVRRRLRQKGKFMNLPF